MTADQCAIVSVVWNIFCSVVTATLCVKGVVCDKRNQILMELESFPNILSRQI